MIFIYPMLTSADVSSNVVPGIASILEKYLLIYEIDELLKDQKRQTGAKSRWGEVIRVKSRLMIREQKPPQKPKLTPDEEEELAYRKEKGKRRAAKEPTEVKIDFPKAQSLAVDPTYVKIDTPQEGVQLLGVKVVAFPVRSNKPFVKILMDDRSRTWLSPSYITKRYSRAIIRYVYYGLRSLKIPFIRSKALTGDPKYDILWATTKYAARPFAVFNYADFSESFFDEPRAIRNLYRLGWSSFIAADDVNKRAIFCMKDFGGVCSTVMYSFMFSTLGSEHARVYNDLEEVRRSAGPFFRVKINRKKLFGESMATSKLAEYRKLLER